MPCIMGLLCKHISFSKITKCDWNMYYTYIYKYIYTHTYIYIYKQSKLIWGVWQRKDMHKELPWSDNDRISQNKKDM